ncbi:squalene synthase Erg9 [Schizosaccharomyces japonicus yFS275]|uniref:Squalene synthase n=1 Tax=Schizosaccharomyces japonicus (strain yFS275 / FY16936) TaxID=402676 RepID=B6K101_SCHJY|nr:squalene synthase Erg9 [Schizosaccharomyces japonicus yFS275]EEB07622.1 squalene synthase Erg9 [Schizosaccharomyces japonicus yFS275]
MGIIDRVEEIRCMCQYKLWHDEPNFEKDETIPGDLRRCYEFLKLTSRSFAAVIMELTPELRIAVMIFYLVLRGLDTIEDDMTISLEKKKPLLLDFYKFIEQPGWNFKESGPNEKDRQLLVEFEVVIAEYHNLKQGYRDVISSIAKEMGSGMAKYATLAEEHDGYSVESLEDFDMYCHYVAGLVGEGLSRLFANSDLETKDLAKQPALSNSVGLFLQKTNIIRDYREDFEDKRQFWPRAIWSKYTDDFGSFCEPGNVKALYCLSEIVANALEHAPSAIEYLCQLQNQQVFNFVAIPQCMAIATLAAVFKNPETFQTNVKIRKGQAVTIIMYAMNIKAVCDIFLRYTREIHAKNTPDDPNFLRISIACGKVEQACETAFPTRFRDMYEQAVATKMKAQKKGQKAVLSKKQKEEHKEAMQYFALSLVMGLIAIFTTLGVTLYFLGFDFTLNGVLSPSRIKNLFTSSSSSE